MNDFNAEMSAANDLLNDGGDKVGENLEPFDEAADPYALHDNENMDADDQFDAEKSAFVT